jgi:arylsulfatase A-like enzyme
MSKPNILLVVMDSVSAGRLSCYGYERQTTPNLDAFAEDSMQFENAIANSSWTVPSHGSLFTGSLPSEHGANARHKRFSVPADRTLAGRLSSHGYRTVGLSANPWVATDFGYDAGFDEFVDVRLPLPFDSNRPGGLYQRIREGQYEGARKYVEAARWALEGNPIKRTINTLYDRRQSDGYANGQALNERVSDWLASKDDLPFFMFLNYMDAHEPYNPSEEYLSEFRDDDCSVDVSWHLRSLNDQYSDREIECINDKYDACLRYLDNKIADLLQTFRRHKIGDETLVIITADHGKCLGEHDYVGVGTFLHEELIKIPLIVSPAGGVISKSVCDDVSLIDIHDIILQAAGIESTRHRFDAVISETLGPHQDVTVREQELPEGGLRRLERDGRVLLRDCATGDLMGSNHLSEAEQAELEEIEDDYLRHRELLMTEEKERQMDPDVKNQLEELGYL